MTRCLYGILIGHFYLGENGTILYNSPPPTPSTYHDPDRKTPERGRGRLHNVTFWWNRRKLQVACIKPFPHAINCIQGVV